MIENKKNIKFRVIIPIIGSILVVILSILYIYKINSHDNSPGLTANKGVLDLRTWDMEETINLDGQWEFYPGKLLKPGEFEKEINNKKYINVPSPWKSHMDGSKEGAGTYRLIVNLPEDGIYGIKTKTIRLASRIYLNGTEVASTGEPSLNREEFVPESKYRVGVTSSLDKKIELIIHVSSFGYKTGGILKSIEFGKSNTIILENNQSRALEILAITACLILGIYFCLLYLQNKKEVFLLYLSLTNLAIAFYFSTMNHQILDLIYDYTYASRTRFQTIGAILTIIGLLRFTYHFLVEYASKKITDIITFINIALMFLLIPNVENLSGLGASIYQITMVLAVIITLIYIYIILLKAIYRKSDLLGYVWTIIVSLTLYWTFISIKVIFEIDIGNIQIFLTLFMFTGVASLLNQRQQKNYQEMHDLTNRLIIYDKQKDDFLATASKELKKPLYLMMKRTRGLIEGKKGTLNSKQQEDLFFINREGRMLVGLVEDLLDASQINMGRTNLNIGAVKSYGMVNIILDEINLLRADDKDIKLINDIPRDFPLLKADADKFGQIVYHLVYNAIKCTNSGQIKISANIDENQANFHIKDTGIGIKEQDLPDIFDIFYKKNEDNNGQDGLGLGLPIVKHLVEIQGGKIDVESVYGQGSTFTFSLPLFTDQSQAIGIKKHKDLKKQYGHNKEVYNQNNKYTILLVDDEHSNQKMILDMIRDMGYNIIFANKGQEIVRSIQKNKVDLVLLDFILSDMSGIQLCRNIREQYSIAELPIIVLIASDRNIDLLNALEYGANDSLKKPVDREELSRKIKSLLLMKSSVEEDLNREFKYFYSQISPHFLYNTLNTIIGISYKDMKKTRKALNNLSIYLRGKLDLHMGGELIPLEMELELIRAYLEIEQLRYEDILEIEYDIDEDAEVMIPPLTLQPLVENSIKHGLNLKYGSIKVKILIKTLDDSVTIIIEDNGAGMSSEKQKEILRGRSERLGLKNVIDKIKRIKGASLELESEKLKGTKIKIIIPKEKSYEGNISG